MKLLRTYCSRLIWVLAPFVMAGHAASEAVWHCSRATVQLSQKGKVDDDNFQLASSGSNKDAVGLSVMDLLDAYSGTPVHVHGKAVTTCFMPGDSAISSQALSSLGLNASSMQRQARRSAIVQSNLRLVTDEAQMLACISDNYPAVGYLSKPVESPRTVPCF